MKRHFGIDVGRSMTFIGEAFERLLPASNSSAKPFEYLEEAFNAFKKDIRDLESLPLELRQLSAISALLRKSSVQSPSFSPQQPLKDPAEVLIQFEGSGRWPDDVVAIQRTKIAFLLKIGNLLEASDESTTTRLGLENEDQTLQNCAFLDIIYQSGATFRLRIHNDREQTLLERQIKDKSGDHHRREDAVSALSTYKRSFVQLPLHTQSMATHCTRFPFLSPTLRLVKIWFNSHMLSGHISDELIELLVVRTFLQPYPWQAPSSVMSGLLRTLLFISMWDWRHFPLIVDFTGTMTSKEVASINTSLEAWRNIDPGMNRTVLFAASNHDMSGTAFTDSGPVKVVAARMTALARSACKLAKDQGLDLDPKSLFTTSTNDYDFVIHLKWRFTDDHRGKRPPPQSRFKNLEVQSETNLDLIGYQPAQLFLGELEKLYTSSIVFFHNTTTDSIIAGLWNPQTASRPFKANVAYATKPAGGVNIEEEGELVEIDKSAILSEIARIGGDLVSQIEVH
jgi:U3 small nucleolar RNA-associated protein 22